MNRPACSLLLLTLLAGAGLSQAGAQAHRSVALDDPVYHVLEVAQARGWVPLLPGAKPYTRSMVVRWLNLVLTADGLGPQDRSLIEKQVGRLTGESGPTRNSRVRLSTELGAMEASVNPTFSLRDSAENPGNFELSTGLTTEFQGDVGRDVSFRLWGGLTWDRIAPDAMSTAVVGTDWRLGDLGAWAPYQFVKTYDGFHQGLSGVNDDGIQKWGVGFHQQSELTFQAFEDLVTARIARFPREWGQGEGSLLLSRTAPAMSSLDGQLQPAPWVNYSWLLATAGDWFNETAANGTTEDKLFTMQRAELQPFSWLQWSISDTVVFSKRFELDYLNPLMLGLFAQNLHGDWDNVGLSTEASAVLPGVGKFSLAVYIDEVSPGDLSDVRNILAWQGGLLAPLPRLPLTSARFQYVKIEPFAYTHYPQKNLPSLRETISLSLANTTQGMNLFYNLPPNSDEWMVKLESLASEELSGSLVYKLIRHGTNALDATGKPISGLIYGAIGQPIDYDYYDTKGYPKKNFLHDGVYDITNLVGLDIVWTPSGFPGRFTLSYQGSYTFFDPNDTGVRVPSPFFQNTIALGATLF